MKSPWNRVFAHLSRVSWFSSSGFLPQGGSSWTRKVNFLSIDQTVQLHFPSLRSGGASGTQSPQEMDQMGVCKLCTKQRTAWARCETRNMGHFRLDLKPRETSVWPCHIPAQYGQTSVLEKFVSDNFIPLRVCMASAWECFFALWNLSDFAGESRLDFCA